MEQDNANSPPETLIKLHKLYQKHHDETAAQQVRLTTDPVAEQIDVALNKYIIPLAKKAAMKGFASTTLTTYQINLDFVKTHLERFETVCVSHGLKIKLEVDPQWPLDLKGLKLSGWADPIPEPPKHHGETLTERIIALEERQKELDREIQYLRAGK